MDRLKLVESGDMTKLNENLQSSMDRLKLKYHDKISLYVEPFTIQYG